MAKTDAKDIDKSKAKETMDLIREGNGYWKTGFKPVEDATVKKLTILVLVQEQKLILLQLLSSMIIMYNYPQTVKSYLARGVVTEVLSFIKVYTLEKIIHSRLMMILVSLLMKISI